MEDSKNGLMKVAFDIPNETRHCSEPGHGEYISNKILKSIWSGCPKCVQESILRQRQAEESEREVQRKAEELKRREARLNQSAIPERFIDRTFDNYVPTAPQAAVALKACREYAASIEDVLKTGRSLILVGTIGTGKTHLSVSIAQEFLKRGLQPIFTTVSKAIRHVKATYSKGCAYTEVEAINMFIKPDLLILDEVGVQFGSDTEKLILFDIINGRYEKLKPTILISNCEIDDLKKFIGARVFDRLRENGGRAILFDWDSHRSSL